MISEKCLYTFLVLLVLCSVALGEPGKKDVAKRDKNSNRVVDKQIKSGLKKRKSKSGKGKGRSKRKRRKQTKSKAKNKKDKYVGRKIRNGGKDKKRKRKGMEKGKKKRKGRRMKKTEKMTDRCQNVTCLNDMLKVLKINKDTVRNFMKQEKRLMGRYKGNLATYLS